MVLGTGSRDFTDRVLARRVLIATGQETGIPFPQILVVHGGQGTRDRWGRVTKGLDLILAEQASALGMQIKGFPADWDTCGPDCPPGHRRPRKWGQGDYCPTAGHRRNQKMIDTFGVWYHCVLAFPIGKSSGTRDCMRRAERVGLRVVNCTEHLTLR